MAKRSRAREATKTETRQALIAAGAAEFADKGIDGASLDGICARAGFTRGAFYVHFHDRDDLLIAVVDRVLSRFQDEVIAADTGAESLESIVVRYVAAVAPGPRRYGKWHFRDTLAACGRLPALRARYVEIQQAAVDRVTRAVRAGQLAGTVRSEVSAHSLAEILVMLTLGITVAFEVALPFDLAGGSDVLWKLVRAAGPRSP